MSEAAPKGQEQNELSGLLAELELQIETLTAGLNRVRGTVARISYAVLTSPAVAVAAAPLATPETPNEPAEALPVIAVAPTPVIPNWLPAPAYQQDPETPEPVPEPGFWDSVAEGASWPRSKPSDALPSLADVVDGAAEAPEIGATARPAPADGAGDNSWMSTPLRAEGLVEALKATAAETAWQVVPPEAGDETDPEAAAWRLPRALPAVPEASPVAAEDGESMSAGAADAASPAWSSVWQATLPPSPVLLGLEAVESAGETAVEPGATDDAIEAAPTSNGWKVVEAPDDSEAEDPEADEAEATSWAPEPAAVHPDETASTKTDAVTDAPLASGDAEASAMPAALSFGWPDESIWSQSFDWPAMKTKEPPPARAIETDPPRGGVSDIVAQVRAELEAARSVAEEVLPPGEEDVAARDGAGWRGSRAEPEADGQAVEGSDRPVAAPAGETLAEPSAEIPGVDGDGAEGRDPGWPEPALDLGTEATADVPVEQDDAARRDEVSRAVEAIRRQIEAGGLQAVMGDEGIETEAPGSTSEFSGAGATGRAGPTDRPAFRLAAPGSIPDWAHMQLEPSGPPVVVMKDADGRVELASVYDTLNELGCGDGAALLNYTPHSVTVGLPASAQFPTTDQMADAVEKVFGLASRVESDGVRITVSIGEDPKRRSVGAA